MASLNYKASSSRIWALSLPQNKTVCVPTQIHIYVGYLETSITRSNKYYLAETDSNERKTQVCWDKPSVSTNNCFLFVTSKESIILPCSSGWPLAQDLLPPLPKSQNACATPPCAKSALSLPIQLENPNTSFPIRPEAISPVYNRLYFRPHFILPSLQIPGLLLEDLLLLSFLFLGRVSLCSPGTVDQAVLELWGTPEASLALLWHIFISVGSPAQRLTFFSTFMNLTVLAVHFHFFFTRVWI